jgi:hypothetical protein
LIFYCSALNNESKEWQQVIRLVIVF